MSLERVVEEIYDRGRREAEEIREAARRDREEMLAEAKEEGEALIEERRQQARDEAERERTRETARAELESRKTVLRAQKEILDRVRERARERLADRSDHEALLRSLVQAHEDDLAKAVVRCNPRDAPVLRKLTKADVRDDLDALGGFVIESESGDLRIDLTYESFLDEAWEENVKALADALWQER